MSLAVPERSFGFWASFAVSRTRFSSLPLLAVMYLPNSALHFYNPGGMRLVTSKGRVPAGGVMACCARLAADSWCRTATRPRKQLPN